MNKRGVERERDIGGLEQLQDIVLLAFVLKLDFVLKVESGLSVPVNVEIEQVTYLSVKADLEVFIKVESSDTAPVGIEHRVITVVIDYLECEVCTARRIDADIGDGQQSVHLLAYLVESGYAAQQPVVRRCIAHRRTFIPVFLHQLVHLIVLILFERHILTADNHISQLGHFRVSTALCVIFHCGGHLVGGLGIDSIGHTHEQEQKHAGHHLGPRQQSMPPSLVRSGNTCRLRRHPVHCSDMFHFPVSDSVIIS